MLRRFAPLCLLAAAGCSQAPAPSAGTHPQRIVSLNLCADQLLLALADDAQIAGLTRNARDAEMSAGAARARGLPMLKPTAEEILAIRPDLLIGVQARGGAIARALDGHGTPLVDLDDAASYPAIVHETRTLAAAIGQRRRGEALIARMDAALAQVAAVGRGRVAAHYQRRGYMTGSGTLVDDLMQRAGLVNLAARLGKPPLSQLSLEEMVAARPDVLILETTSQDAGDQGAEMLRHPALAGIPRIHVPQAWTVCGGPAYIEAARSMAEQLARLDRRATLSGSHGNPGKAPPRHDQKLSRTPA